MAETWIVVAHRAGARIVEYRGPKEDLALVEALDHPRGRDRSGALDSDRAGLSFSSAGEGGGHPMSPAEDAHDHAARVFAKQIAERLSGARVKNRCDTLVLVAEPRFLGFLKDALDGATRTLVKDTVGKDLAHVELSDLPRHLASVFRFAQPKHAR